MHHSSSEPDYTWPMSANKRMQLWPVRLLKKDRENA